MTKKDYIDWLNNMINIKEREIELMKKVGNKSAQDRLIVELNIFQICLNHIKGR